MKDSNRLAYLFYRYYEKKCTQSEKDEFFELLQDPRHDAMLRKLIGESWSYELPVYLQAPQSADRILQYITSQQPSIPQRRIIDYRSLMKYAAVLVLLASASAFVCYKYSLRTPLPQAVIAAIPKPPGDRCLTLSDGSKVLLHKNARIDYKPFLAGTTREVTLTGEAYFDIRHEPRPFIVHTGRITTTVLGTAFNIDSHEQALVITVVKGKVKVDDGAGDFSILRRNEQVTVDVIHNRIKKVMVDAGEAISWKKPYLLFNDVNMKDAIGELELRFHVGIVLTNPASENCHVTATFTQGEPLEQIIKVLSKVNSMTYKAIPSGGYELSGESCK